MLDDTVYATITRTVSATEREAAATRLVLAVVSSRFAWTDAGPAAARERRRRVPRPLPT